MQVYVYVLNDEELLKHVLYFQEELKEGEFDVTIW